MNVPAKVPSFAIRVWRHLVQGTLAAALRRKYGPPRLNRFNAQTPEQAAKVLAELALATRKKGATALLVSGVPGIYLDHLTQHLQKAQATYKIIAPNQMSALQDSDLVGVSCIVLAVLDSRTQLDLALQLLRNPTAALIPLEYICIPQTEHAPIMQWDRHRDGGFASPLLGKFGQTPYEIYRESLSRFQLKTDIRDYLDFWQLLTSICSRAVPGNIAEFGSFKGHSGYLISRILEHLQSDKTLFMFDMFENFPQEEVGVDRFWSGTHAVDFNEVKKKFADRQNVRLVKGDFSQTLPQTDTGPLALAYIDCDSYRATKYLLEYLWSERIPVGGIVAMEDYGHAALLGNRVAVHEFFDGRRDAYTYFSQFSGFFVAVKLPSGVAA